MASSHDSVLKTKLLNLESRFTWELRKDDIDIASLQIRLQDYIQLDLGRDAGVARSYSFLAYVRYLQGYPEEAIEHLRKAEDLTREQHGDDCEKLLIVTYGDLSWLHYHIGDYARSQGYLDKVERIREKFPMGSGSTTLHPEVYGEKGWTFLKFSRVYYHRALECFRKALELEPEESEWNEGYAIALHRTEDELSSPQDSPVITQLRRALEIKPEDGLLQALLAIRLALYGKLKEAEELVEKALTMSPDCPHVTRYVGKYLRQYGHADRSISLLKRALDRDSQSPFINHQLALCYKYKKNEVLQQGGFHENVAEAKRLRGLCIQHLEKVVSVESSFVSATVELAIHYGEDGDHGKAEKLFQTALEMERWPESIQKTHLYYGRFQQYEAKCESEAIEHYTKGLQLEKDSKDGRRCAEMLRRIAKQRAAKDPSDGAAYGLLGWLCQMQGETSQAVEWYEKALACDTENAEYLSALCELRLVL